MHHLRNHQRIMKMFGVLACFLCCSLVNMKTFGQPKQDAACVTVKVKTLFGARSLDRGEGQFETPSGKRFSVRDSLISSKKQLDGYSAITFTVKSVVREKQIYTIKYGKDARGNAENTLRLPASDVLNVFVPSDSIEPWEAQGENAYREQFDSDAQGYSSVNAYLLAYLCTWMYPDHLAAYEGLERFGDAWENRTKQLFRNENAGMFEQAYRDEMGRYFGNDAEIRFLHKTLSCGFDPEVVVASTPDTVFVVFRGTDRVGNRPDASIGYEYFEWLTSDFQFMMIEPDFISFSEGVKIHSGFLCSVELIKDELIEELRNQGAEHKKIWITGHSLGAAQAQIFGAYLCSNEYASALKPTGIYTFASPHVGNVQFKEWFNNRIGERLQRFDFAHDPITALPPYSFGFERAGVRNYCGGVAAEHFQQDTNERPEMGNVESTVRGALEVGKMVIEKKAPGLFHAAEFSMNTQWKMGNQDYGDVSPFGFHHPTWYLLAAHNQLETNMKSLLPLYWDEWTPTASWDALNQATVDRAINGPGSFEQLGNDTGEVLDEIVHWTAETAKNFTGQAVEEGHYYIKNFSTHQYLQIGNKSKGYAVHLTQDKSEATKFKVEWVGNGYIIYKKYHDPDGPSGNMDLVRRVEQKSEDWVQNKSVSKVQVWDEVLGFSPQQNWYFYRVIHQSMFVIVNSANQKALDDTGVGDAKLKKAADDDQTQLWVLEN